MGDKMFVFVAGQAWIAAIVCKFKKNGRPCYQLLRWDLTTNEISEGQWLMNKQLFVRGCSISPNGQLFGWIYNQYWRRDGSDTHAGISVLPNFTAELYGDGACGRWNHTGFDEQNRPVPGNLNFVKRGTLDIELSVIHLRDALPSGLQKQNFQLSDGRNVRIEGYQLFVNDVLLYDAESNEFVNRPKMEPI
jgi:hypothetical protein